MMSSKNAYIAFPIFFILLSHFSVPVHSGAVYPVHTKGSGCGSAVKIIAILVTSMIGGACLPLVMRSMKALNLFVVVKAFAAGIIQGTGFLRDAVVELFAGELCFHQMLEGMGLGGCILQAEYKFIKKAAMAFFFSVGI